MDKNSIILFMSVWQEGGFVLQFVGLILPEKVYFCIFYLKIVRS